MTFLSLFFFFFNDTATTEIYTYSLHDSLPICRVRETRVEIGRDARDTVLPGDGAELRDRKSTRLNSSHDQVSYAVFCLKKKKNDATLRRIMDRWRSLTAERSAPRT